MNYIIGCGGVGSARWNSEADIKVTRDLMRAGQLLKIEIADHIILGGQDKHTSLRALGYLSY